MVSQFDFAKYECMYDEKMYTREYFFEELIDEFSEFYPTDCKLMSLGYNEDSRDNLRRKISKELQM